MTSFFRVASSSADIEVWFQSEEQRKHVDIKVEKDRRMRYPVYLDGESVIGKIVVNGKKLQHDGINVSFIGSIETQHGKNRSVEFLYVSQELAAPGEIQKQSSFDFEFKKVEKQYESFHGYNVRLRYYVLVVISRKMSSDIVREREIWVHTYNKEPMDRVQSKSIKMEVGIENCLHLEFEYNKPMYHLRDVIIGKINFKLVRIKIKAMEVSIIRRETTGSVPNTYNKSENMIKYQIMDGAPQKGEMIPLRLFLGGFELGPTFQDINKKFSVRYYLHLVLIDIENRRYFKQHEITLYRQ